MLYSLYLKAQILKEIVINLKTFVSRKKIFQQVVYLYLSI